MTSTLTGLRVLDLTERFGEIAGRMLADLGAEVLKVEPPGGCFARHLPPFDSRGESLYWKCYGAGKQSCTLDLDTPSGFHQFLQLVAGADVLVESFDPARARALNIVYETLAEQNPGLIHVAITPFGRAGPRADCPATSLTIEAAGGRLSIQGDTDRPPLPVGFPQAGLHGGAQAAADVLVALHEREQSGLGQFLDLSMQEVMWWTLMGAQGYPICLGEDPPGAGDDRGPRPQGLASRVVDAKDGLITIAPGASPAGTKTMFTFAMEEESRNGPLDHEIRDISWDDWVRQYRDGKLTREVLNRATDILLDYLSGRTKLQLVTWALRNNLRLGPLNTTRDLIRFPHYLDRGVFAEIGDTRQVANWVRLSRTPLRPNPASRLNETPPGWQQKQWDRTGSGRRGLAFEGLKVADFSWVAAGPTITKALADHGATVVKIETANRPDLSRTLAPHIDGDSEGLNRSYWSFLYASSKLSLQCNLASEEGRELARRVCDWADVVVESFSPGTMKRMGLGYNTLAQRNPSLIMLSTSMLGQTGPLRQYAGYGQQAAGFCGLHYITGWPDKEPCGVASPYTDVVAPKFGIASLAAAIYEARRSGQGQLIDLSQAECAMMFMAPFIADEFVNGRTAERTGMDSAYACPHGVFACRGTERYIAISVETTQQWRNLAPFLGEASLAAPAYDAMETRREINDDLNRLLQALCRDSDPWELESRLQAAGVPASVVKRPTDVFVDPQIEARGLKQVLTHPECGDVVHYGFPTRFSARAEMIRTPPPLIGQHNDHVLKDLLGLPDDEVKRLYAVGAIE